MRSNGDVPCHDDAGADIILGRAQLLEKEWSIWKVIEGPLYNSVRLAFKDNRTPWPGICETCAWYRPNEPFSETMSKKFIRTFQLEPSLACNLKCLCCSQPQQLLERPKPYKMPVELFESTLRSMKHEGYIIKEIEYCGQGEAMTHPQFNEFVDLARTFFPNTIQRLITNGNFDYSRAKLTAAIDEIMVSCDGARQESYEQYRIGGNMAKVLKFMRDVPKFVGDKRQRVVWKYILFEFNDSDSEIIEAQKLAEQNGADTLLFVFTHTRYKSERYTAANSHKLPIVWHGARANATPIHYQSVREFYPVATAGWPARSADNQSSMMIDDITMDGGGGFRVRGWVISLHEIDRVRLTHNGLPVGETSLRDLRPDVEEAHPTYTGGNPGFALGWKGQGPTDGSGNHEIGVELISGDAQVVGQFLREFLAA